MCITAETQDRMMFHMAGIVVLTLLVNGWAAGTIVAYLDLNVSCAAAGKLYIDATNRLFEFTDFTSRALARQPRYRGANMKALLKFMPVYSNATLEKSKAAMASDANVPNERTIRHSRLRDGARGTERDGVLSSLLP